MISRRSLLLGAVSLPVGISIGAGAHVANRPQPSIRVIGSRHGMLVTLETGSERVLILAGEVDEDLWQQRSSLMTLGRKRIDAIVSTYSALTTVAIPNLDANDSTVIYSLQRSMSLPPLRGNVFPVADVLEMKLGDAGRLAIQVVPSIDGDGAPDFLVTFEVEDTRSIVSSNSTAVRHVTESGIAAIIVPGAVDPEDMLGVGPELVVTTDTERLVGSPRQLLVFSDSAAELLLDRGMVRVNRGQVLS